MAMLPKFTTLPSGEDSGTASPRCQAMQVSNHYNDAEDWSNSHFGAIKLKSLKSTPCKSEIWDVDYQKVTTPFFCYPCLQPDPQSPNLRSSGHLLGKRSLSQEVEVAMVASQQTSIAIIMSPNERRKKKCGFLSKRVVPQMTGQDTPK